MTKMRRDANAARLRLWFSRIAGTLLQIRIVKPTFGRPRYRYDVHDTWTISAEEWVGPDLDEASRGHTPCLLLHSQHLPDEMAQLRDEQEPGTFDGEGQ